MDYPLPDSSFWPQGVRPASLPSSQIQTLPQLMDEPSYDGFPQLPFFLQDSADFFAPSASAAHDTSTDLGFFGHDGFGDPMSFAHLQSQEMPTTEINQFLGPIFDDGEEDFFGMHATDPIPSGPLPRSRKRKAPTMRDEDWAPVKRRVIQLHIDKKIPLPEVKKQIENEFKSLGFTATIRQYRSRLSQWGVDKKVKPKEMKAIVRKRLQRTVLEKEKGELMFRVRGSVVEPHKIDRWMKKNRITQDAAFSPRSIASTPSALSAFTRSERGTPKRIATSPIALPPFIGINEEMHVNNSSAVTSPVVCTNPRSRVFTAPEFRLQTQLFENLPILQLPVSMQSAFESIKTVGGASFKSDSLLRTVTEVTAKHSSYPSIDSLIPYSALKVTGHPVGMIGFQQIDAMNILLFIYLVSNSFPADAKRDAIYQLVKSQKHFSQAICRVLKGPSVDSMIENLFALAIEAEDVQMVKTLITAGANVNPNNCKFRHVPIPMTPLQFACLKNNAALVQTLIAAGSEVDAPESGWKCSTILLALYGHEQLVRWDGFEMLNPDYEQLLDLVQKLLDGGARVNNGELFRMNETTESIRQYRSGLQRESHFYELLKEEHSPLTLACQYKYHRVVDFLIEKGADPRFSMDGISSALRQCLHNIPVWFEGTPCKLAERLDEWEEESEVRSTIVRIARSLIRAGADLNDHVVDECDSEWCEHCDLECFSNLDLAILVGDLELVDEMLRADARPTYHSLDLAIEIRSFDLFGKLLAKGAAIPNWAITEDYSSSSDDIDDCSPSSHNVDLGHKEPEFTEVQKRRALILAAVRLGATPELKNFIQSMDGSENLLSDCTGLTRAIEDCCAHGHLGTLQYLLAANIMPNPRPDTLFGRSVFLSIQHGHNLLDLLIENNADLNVAQSATRDCNRELPLSRAIKNGHLQVVQKLIQGGASVEDEPHVAAYEKLGSMLVAAIEAGNEAIVDEVLGACEDINALGKMENYSFGAGKYCTPLTMAIKKRNWILVDILRRDGAKVNHPDQGPGTSGMVHHHTALWAATSQKHINLVQTLIESGAVVNDRMALEAAVNDDDLLSLFIDKLSAAPRVNKKFNALHFALRKSIHQGISSKVKMILDSMLVDLNSTQGGETLHELLNRRQGPGVDHALLDMLLSARANPQVFVSCGKTAIHDAIDRDDARSVQMILDAGAEVSPPFLPAVYYSPAQLAAKSGNTEVLQLLLARGCDPNAVAPGGQSKGGKPIGTALQCATESKSFEAVQLLLMKKADPNAVTEKLQHTALQIACRDGSKNIVELLITEGANVNALPAREFGATALQYAALGGYLGIAHLLLEWGANVNAAAAEVDGRTALEAAAEYGRIDMIQFLVDAGADLSKAKNGQYEHALTRASDNGHFATRCLLLSYLS